MFPVTWKLSIAAIWDKGDSRYAAMRFCGCDTRVSDVGGEESPQDLSQSTVRQENAVSSTQLNLIWSNDMSEHTNQSEKPAAGWRIKLGAALFGISILLPVAGIPLAATLGLSKTMIASVSGALLVGAEVLGVCAVAIMGKSGYAFIKNRIFGFLKQYGPPQKVSKGRYKIGLMIFCVPFLFGWLSPYISKWVPDLLSYPLAFAIGGDILILASLFLLGGDFWDKIRSLFIHNAEVRFKQTST
jgi:hypothetical protein